MTTEVSALIPTPARTDDPAAGAGRHRRVYAQLVVHLVFADLSEHRLGADSAAGRSLGHAAGWLLER